MKGVIILGDANASGRGSTVGWADMLQNKVREDFFNVQYNLSIPGETSQSLLKNVKNEVKRRTWYRKEKDKYLAILSVGRDDAKSIVKPNNTQTKHEDFELNIKRILAILKPLVTKTVVLAIPPVIKNESSPHTSSNTYHSNKIIKQYNNILENLSTNFINPFQDIKDYKKYLTKGIFLNKKGHELYYYKINTVHNKFISS